MSPEERFWSKVDKNGPVTKPELGSCWLWTDSLLKSGYAQFYCDGQSVYVHRYSYEQEYGLIPDRLEIDHLCRIRHCVNPAHLEAVSHLINILRRVSRNKTHCIRQHEFNSVNTYITPDGRRQCRVCRKERNYA